jgi:hypothetical protein
MATANDLIRRSLRILGVLASGETPEASEANDGLTAVNAMLDSWQTDRLKVYALQEDSFTLTGGDGEYTIGAGGDINVTRPEKIESAFIRSSNIDYYLEPVGEQAYNQIPDKTTQSLPDVFYYNSAYPLGTIKLYPVPDSAYALHVTQWTHLQSFATLADTFALPSGYEDAIVFNLAKRLAPEYGVMLSMDVKEQAAETLAAIKRKNIGQPKYANSETVSLGSSGRGGFDITRGI